MVKFSQELTTIVEDLFMRNTIEIQVRVFTHLE